MSDIEPTPTDDQLTLFDIEPTPAMASGAAYLASCRNCGLLLYVPSRGPAKMALGPCPACDAATGWSTVKVPDAPGAHVVGPFHRKAAP